MELRNYQKEAYDAILSKLETNKSTLVVMPTGTGKTIVFAHIAKHFCELGKRVLIIAHREELIYQATEKIRKITHLPYTIEMGEYKTSTFQNWNIMIASVQTLARKSRRERIHPKAFGLIIVDEAHHVLASTYKKILDYFENTKILGVTATPYRMDKQSLNNIFESVAYAYDIRDAINDGYLVPIRQHSIKLEDLDLTNIKIINGDFSTSEIEEVMTEERILHATVIPTIELAGNRPTMVFSAGVLHAYKLTEIFNRYRPDSAIAVDGKSASEVRRQAIGDFMAGKKQFLVNCALFTEGFDAPLASCIAQMRPTQSRVLYSQVIGRGTRPSPETGKRDLLVLDFVGNSYIHSLVTVVDILDNNQDKEVKQRTLELCEQNPKKSVLEAMQEAEELVASERRAKVICEAKYRIVNVDPFNILGSSSRQGRWGGIEPTEKQIAILVKNGLDVNGLDKGQAGALIDAIISRQQDGLCTYKMARQLAKRGLNPDVSFEDARKAMDLIAANKWKTPGQLYMDPVFMVKEKKE